MAVEHFITLVFSPMFEHLLFGKTRKFTSRLAQSHSRFPPSGETAFDQMISVLLCILCTVFFSVAAGLRLALNSYLVDYRLGVEELCQEYH